MADLVRVCATDAAGNCDISHAIATPPNITFTLEAAASEWAGGELYRVSGFVRDYGTGTVAVLGPINGNLTDANWPTRNHKIVFPLPAAVAGIAASNGVVEAVGVVRIGAPMPGADTDIETSMFTWV